MSNLNLQKLSELCTLYSGGTPSTSNESYWNGNLNWMSSGETSNKLIYGTKLKITEKGVAESSTRLAHSGDTVVATAGEGKTRGQTSYLLTDTYVNQSIVVLKADKTKIDNKFLFYALSNSYNRMRALSDAAGIRGSLPCKLLNNFEINTFNLDIENKIGQFLFNIDLKIENNNKINAELESLAKTIYDYWFLQFEFPNEEGKPYKSSGGKMVWNKELKREIPEGLAVKKLNSIANLYQPEILPSNLMKEDGKYFVYGANGIVGRYNKFNHEHPEIAICCRGASCGNYLMTLPKSWITGNSMVVTPKDSSVTKEYLYHSLRYIDIKRYVTGSAQPQITRSNLDGIKVVIPPFKSLEHFSNKAEKIRNELIKNINENNELSSLRDFLLPMLMNGQVQFK